MKRKIPPGRKFSVLPKRDIMRDINPDVLAGIGAVSLAWNNFEAGINIALSAALQIEFKNWIHVYSRINGFDGKVAIIKAALSGRKLANDATQLLIADTLGRAEELKRYRDGVIHANILDPTSPVAPTHDQRGSEYETLITSDALFSLYIHLLAITAELDSICGIIVESDGGGAMKGDGRKRRPSAKRTQAYVARLREHQKRRKSLEPLPKFPQLDQDRPSSEASPALPS